MHWRTPLSPITHLIFWEIHQAKFTWNIVMGGRAADLVDAILRDHALIVSMGVSPVWMSISDAMALGAGQLDNQDLIYCIAMCWSHANIGELNCHVNTVKENQ